MVVYTFYTSIIMQQITSHKVSIISNTRDIEFAIWLLIHQGIHYPPFDYHEQKPNPHFTPDQWYQWLRRLMRSLDSRLEFGVNAVCPKGEEPDTIDYDDIEEEVELGITSQDVNWERAYATPPFEIDSLDETKAAYQQALIEWDITPEQIDTNTPIYELPECPPYIRDNYNELVQTFISIHSDITGTVVSQYFKRDNLYVPRDDIHIHFVEYPILVSMYVYPNAFIVSVPNKHNRIEYVKSVQKLLDDTNINPTYRE